MTSRARRILLWSLSVVFLAATVIWTLHVPYIPTDLFRPIHADAAFVSQHRDLAQRWPALHRNPLMRSILITSGLKPSALRDLETDPVARQWFEKLASRDTVLAYVPELGAYREPAWVATSWIGGRSQRLRWNLGWHEVEGFKRNGPHRGHPFWTVESTMTGSGDTLTLALVEGMVIACLSRHPETMRDVLDTYDGVRPSILERRGFPREGEWCDDAAAPDRGWVDAGAMTHLPAMLYEFSELTPTTIVGVARAAGPSPGGLPPRAPATGVSLASLLGDTPIMLGMLPAEWASALPDRRRDGPWARILREIIAVQKADTVAVGLFGGEYGGRLKGIRMPSLLLALPVTDEAAAHAQIRRALDNLNARYRWGLIPHRADTSTESVVVFEGTAGNLYGSLPLEEKPAYSICGGWLLLGSNSDALGRLVARYRAAGADAAAPCWSPASDASGAPAYVWADFARGAPTLRLAISAYSLKLLMEDAQKTMGQRQRLNEIKAWIDAMEPIGQCAVWMESRPEDVRVRFRMGRFCSGGNAERSTSNVQR